MSEKKTYDTRGVASPLNHQIYTDFIQKLGIKPSEELDLKQRGLTTQQIAKAQYATKPNFKENNFINAMAYVSNHYSLEGVPGFLRDNEKGFWTCQPVSGLVVPCRDYNGNITSLLIRNDRAALDDDSGKKINKYVSFSSGGKKGGGKIFQTTHCPIITGPCLDYDSTTVRITEGVLKADVATALGKIYCLGLQGLNVRSDLKVIIKKMECQELLIALDSGEDDSTDILRCTIDLIKICEDLEIDYKIEMWDSKLGKGIDDVIKNGHQDKIRYATEDEITEIKERAHHKNPYNGEWAYIIQQERFYHKYSDMELNKSQFANKFGIAKMQTVNEMLADGYEQYDKLTYEPGRELIIRDGNVSLFNVWRDGAVEAIEASDEDVKLFIDHISYLFPDEKYQAIVLDYLAHCIQFPGKKIKWALVIIGTLFGTGKSFIGDTMKEILGHHNVNSPTMEAIHGEFTGWQKGCELIIIEELMARGKQELMNKLKPMMVAEMAHVREMRKEEYDIPNRYNFLCYSNYDDPIIVEKGDRRYGVVKTEVEPKEKEYYDTIFEWIIADGTAGKLKGWFLKRDISKFNSKFAPMTEAKEELISTSRSQIDEWVQDGIANETFPFNLDIVCIKHLKDKRVCPPGFDRLTDQRFAAALKKAGAKKFPAQIAFEGRGKFWVWILRRHEMLLSTSPTVLKTMYEKKSFEQEPGNNDWNPLADIAPM